MTKATVQWSRASFHEQHGKTAAASLCFSWLSVSWWHIFFWQNQRQTVGIFRLLGGTKKQAVLAVLHCALAITVLGAAAGGILGCGVTNLAGTGIMEENLERKLETDMTGAYDMSGFAEQEQTSRIQADPLATLGAGAATLLYPLFLLGFAALDINKEPRELLPKGKG